MKQIKLEIPNYEGLYCATNDGKIYSIKKNVMLKSQRLQNNGYLITDLYKNNIQKTATVHRLIALTFIPNPKDKPCVNHINGIKTDNNVYNLEWCTHSENQIHSVKIGTRRCDKIIQKDLNNNTLNIFNSTYEASIHTGISKVSIWRVCNGLYPNIKGFKFINYEDTSSKTIR